MRVPFAKMVFQVSLLAAAGMAGAIIASSLAPAGMAVASAGAAFGTAIAFAATWSVSRLGGPLFAGVTMLVFGLVLLDNLLAGDTAAFTGYAAGLVWAIACVLCDLLEEFKVLRIRGHHKLY